MVRFDAPSAEFFLDWQTNTNSLLQLGFDGASELLDLRDPGKVFLRIAVLAFFTGTGAIVDQAFALTAHDARHMEAARAIGATDVGLVRSDNLQDMSIGEFFFEAFNFTAEPGLYTYTKANATLAEQAYVSGEGLDTNMLIADMTARKIGEGAGHITDLAPYVLNKLWGINYFLQTGPTSDAGNYVRELNQQGYAAVTTDRVIGLQLASVALSGGSLSLMRGAWDFVTVGSSAVQPLRLRVGEGSVFWPEVTTWLNPDNVSLRITVDAEWKDVLRLRAGVDTPVLGSTAGGPELTLGASGKIQTLRAGLEATTRFVGFPLFIATAELDLDRMFSFGVEGHYGERSTMREMREYPLGPGAALFLTARLQGGP